VSFLFWFVGLIPDLATLRDRSQSRAGQIIYGALAMGWRGSALHWHRYETGVSAARPGWRRRSSCRCTRSSASTSRSASCPGWHTTIFPPYFVAGAIYSGFAMVLTAAIPIRAIYARRLHHDAPPAEHGEGACSSPG
jgi:molybdopterin-containing oxidoreductase family membrane subunit